MVAVSFLSMLARLLHDVPGARLAAFSGRSTLRNFARARLDRPVQDLRENNCAEFCAEPAEAQKEQTISATPPRPGYHTDSDRRGEPPTSDTHDSDR